MRTFAVWRSDRMRKDRFTPLVKRVQERHRRVEKEEAVERQAGARTGCGYRLMAPKIGIVAVSGGGGDRQPVKGTTQNDDEQARITSAGGGQCARERGREGEAGARS